LAVTRSMTVACWRLSVCVATAPAAVYLCARVCMSACTPTNRVQMMWTRYATFVAL
jgi:hypothetical protein